MSINNSIAPLLNDRSGSKCELCAASASDSPSLTPYAIPPNNEGSVDQSILLCATCCDQIENPENIDPHHWRCLNDSMWSPVPAVQVVVWRMLHRLKSEGWPQDLLDSLYLEPEVQTWAEADSVNEEDADSPPTFDSNRTALSDGDNVILIKDLAVKGAGFTAKRGTAVKNISLTSNPLHIEGRINGTQIVLVAAYLKKT